MNIDFSRDTTEGDLNNSNNRHTWRASIDHDSTLDWLEEDERWFLRQSLSTPCIDVLTSCKGSALTNLRGQSYIDFHGNSAHQVGYANPAVIEVIKKQLDTLTFCPRRYTNLPAIELARELIYRAPGQLAKVLFAPSGTAVIGMALKLARLATGRFKTISWWDSFHGASLDAISVGGEALFRQGMGPLLPGAMHVPPPGAVLESGRRLSAMESADYAAYVMEREGDIAAFIAEPLRCTTVIIPPVAYWKRMRELCDRHGALLIFDEIPVALGRTGRMFACEHFDVAPDILCLGKGLGGGIMPLAAMLARADLDIAPDLALGHYTHEKNPVACAAGLATLRYLDEEILPERIGSLGELFGKHLKMLGDKYTCIGDIRHIGLLAGVELVQNRETLRPAPDLAEAVLYGALRRGLSFKVSSGNVLTLAPPLTISEEELAHALACLDGAIEEACAQVDHSSVLDP